MQKICKCKGETEITERYGKKDKKFCLECGGEVRFSPPRFRVKLIGFMPRVPSFERYTPRLRSFSIGYTPEKKINKKVAQHNLSIPVTHEMPEARTHEYRFDWSQTNLCEIARCLFLATAIAGLGMLVIEAIAIILK
jgi:hypothetical protein